MLSAAGTCRRSCFSALRVGRARKANLSDEELKAAVQTAMPLNLGAFFVSMIGLGCVLVGVILG